MADAVVEVEEVMVTNKLIPMQEFDKIRNAVCLLKSSNPSNSWRGTGFYVNVKLKEKIIGCIMTNYHVYCEMKKSNDGMAAVFCYEKTEKDAFELPLVPFKLLAQSKDLDYVLIRVTSNEDVLQSKGVEPILVDSNLPAIGTHDSVYIIQHPGGIMKHFSHDKVKRVNKPFIEYYADTLSGSSGSPVFVLNQSRFSLIALHSKGVNKDVPFQYPENWNKGVLIEDILNHLHTGKVTQPDISLPHGVPGEMESRVDLKKNPSKQVTRDDIIYIANDITDEWDLLGRALGHSDSTLKIIDTDNAKVYNKCYMMLTKWTQIMVSEANYGALAKGFAHPTVNRSDLISKYC